MTGTAMTEEDEFKEIYKLDVIAIPTNKPVKRIDHNDQIYRTEKGKFHAIIDKIVECNQKGQPILVGTISIEKSELLSAMLKRKGIKHEVLNAKHHPQEKFAEDQDLSHTLNRSKHCHPALLFHRCSL